MGKEATYLQKQPNAQISIDNVVHLQHLTYLQYVTWGTGVLLNLV